MLFDRGVFFCVLNTIQFKDYSSSNRSVQGTYSEVSMRHSPCFQRLYNSPWEWGKAGAGVTYPDKCIVRGVRSAP